MTSRIRIEKSVLSIIVVCLLFFCQEKPTSPKYLNPFDLRNEVTKGDPFNLEARIESNGVLLNWDLVQMPKLASYRIYRSSNTLNFYILIKTISIDSSRYLDTNVERGRSYFYQISVIDSNNNINSRTNIATVRINMNPVVVINNGEKYTNSIEVGLSITALSASHFMVSNRLDMNQSSWIEYKKNYIYPWSPYQWKLLPGDGEREIYLKVLYSDSTVSEVVSDAIIVDTTPPIALVSVSPDTGITGETSFYIDASNSYDAQTDKADLTFHWDFDTDGTFDTEWQSVSGIEKVYPIGGGERMVKTEVKDGAGNISSAESAFFVNTRPTAAFTTEISSEDSMTVRFTITSSSDYEDGTDLLYRWDFEGDGSWDTEYMQSKSVSYQFTMCDDWPTKLEVKDKNNLTNQFSNDILCCNYYDTGTLDIYCWGDPFGQASRTQSIYTRIPGPVIIEQIAFKFIAGLGRVRNTIIKMKEVSEEYFTWSVFHEDNLTKCFQGELIVEEEGWYTFPLDIPFHYTKTGNLLLEISSDTADAWYTCRSTPSKTTVNPSVSQKWDLDQCEFSKDVPIMRIYYPLK